MRKTNTYLYIVISYQNIAGNKSMFFIVSDVYLTMDSIMMSPFSGEIEIRRSQ
jgi:hypothetical protein